MSDFGEYTCFICSKKYQGPYNNRHNALKKHGKKVHGEHSGFVCESLKCHFKEKAGQKGCQIEVGKKKMIWAMEVKEMHENTYNIEKSKDKLPAIPDERKIFKCVHCPETHRGFVEKKSLKVHIRDQHNLDTPDDRKKTPREPKSKKARRTILETPHHEAVVNGNSNESSWILNYLKSVHFFFTNSLL